MDVYTLAAGTSPLVVSMPHSGLALSAGMAERLTPAATGLPDTDWPIPQPDDFLKELGASTICANATVSTFGISLAKKWSPLKAMYLEKALGFLPKTKP